MHATETVIIGAGQAGLALSRHLTSAGRDHVVVDRGRLAERWRSERWDSLRLLTPNWMTRLPGWSYDGPDPDGFMTAAEVVAFFEAYAASFGAPVLEGVTVESVEPAGGGFRVSTDAVTWRTANVVVATGAADVPRVPGLAGHLPAHVHQITPSRYRNPAGLPDGGVLVVGASSSGLQIADELARAGRRVVLAVGDHNRMPRRYRGRDVMWWLDRTGVFDTRIEDVPHPERSRRSPSMQLVGRPDHGDLDLGTVHRQGVELAGRLVDVDGGVVRFADDLAATTARAEARLCRVLDGIDACIAGAGLDARVAPPDRPAPLDVPSAPRHLHLRGAGIGTVVWATGYRQAYPWLRLPGLDHRQGLSQTRGAVEGVDGLFVLGQRFQTRRSSNFIDGVRHDARLVADRIARRAPSRAAA